MRVNMSKGLSVVIKTSNLIPIRQSGKTGNYINLLHRDFRFFPVFSDSFGKRHRLRH
jgi:hypothetical protein